MHETIKNAAGTTADFINITRIADNLHKMVEPWESQIKIIASKQDLNKSLITNTQGRMKYNEEEMKEVKESLL